MSLLDRVRALLGDDAVEIAGGAGAVPRVAPASPDAVALLLGTAREEGWRVRLEGAGTWLPADAPADLALTTRRLDRVPAVEPQDLSATAEAGIGCDLLRQQLADHGTWLALDPPGLAGRTLGSVVATATAGPLRHGFGAVRDHILGVTFVTGDGRLVQSGGRVVKNVAGYEGDAQDVVTHCAEALAQRPRGRRGHDGAERAPREPRRIEREPRSAVGELLAQQVAADPRLGSGGEVLGLDRRNAVEPPGGEREVCGSVSGQPRAGALEPDAPSLLAGRAEQQRDRVGGGGRHPRHRIRAACDFHGVVPEQCADSVEEAHAGTSSHEPRGTAPGSAAPSLSRSADPGPMARGFAAPDHSRHACTGTTFPGFTRSSGSHTRRTARIAVRDSASKINGI